MNHEVTLQISERVFRQATIIAAQKNCRIEDVLSDWLEKFCQKNFPDKTYKSPPKD